MASGHFDGQRVSGQFPQHGAIFMSDNFTRKECFQRKLFGLPSRFLKFVQKVKAGMMLFLFDYQERKLYGVFEATTDGSMNIVQHAYKSSRMSFPAQVRFRIIWRCYPVPEHDFCHIIKENYYAHNKFHFGLSSNQVQELLCLFKNKRIGIVEMDSNLVKKMKSKVCCLVSEPAAAESCECDISEASEPSMSTLEKPDNAPAVSEGGELALEDFIPLPSSDSEDESSSPKTDDGRSDVEFSAITSRIQCETQVKKLYSDRQKERTSAFHRLSKTSRLKKEATNARRRASLAEDKSLAIRKSVFSRLSDKVPESTQERTHLKRNKSWTVKNLKEIECFIAENKQKKRRLDESCGKRVDIKVSDHCAMVQVDNKLPIQGDDHCSASSSTDGKGLMTFPSENKENGDSFTMVPLHVDVEGCSENVTNKTDDDKTPNTSSLIDGKNAVLFPLNSEGAGTENKHLFEGDNSCTENAVTAFKTNQQWQSHLSTSKDSAKMSETVTISFEGEKGAKLPCPVPKVETPVCLSTHECNI